MKYCVVNFVTKNAWYLKGQERLRQSLTDVEFKGDFLGFVGEESLGCERHHKVPYAFKPAALLEAKNLGYDCVLWLDASFWALREVDSLFEKLKKEGHLLQSSSYSVGMWCSDKALVNYGLADREEAFSIPLLMGGFVGLNLGIEKSILFLHRWYGYSIDGISFPGAWTNENHEVSADPRVRGHRHDMPALSMAAQIYSLSEYPLNTFCCYKSTHDVLKKENSQELDRMYFTCQGM